MYILIDPSSIFINFYKAQSHFFRGKLEMKFLLFDANTINNSIRFISALFATEFSAVAAVTFWMDLSISTRTVSQLK